MQNATKPESISRNIIDELWDEMTESERLGIMQNIFGRSAALQPQFMK